MSVPIDDSLCPLCKADNRCGNRLKADKDVACWCMSEAIPKSALSAIVPALKGRACVCQVCARRYRASDENPQTAKESLPSTSGVSVAEPIPPKQP